MNSALVLTLALSIAASAPSKSFAYETDQYTDRAKALLIKDSTDLIDARINKAIQKIAKKWKTKDGVDNAKFALKLKKEIIGKYPGTYLLNKIEMWLKKSKDLKEYRYKAKGNIYSHGNLKSKRALILCCVVASVKVNGVLVGADKIDHFFATSHDYYRISLEENPEVSPIERGQMGEGGVIGLFISGTYSNADLVANYEGFNFYRSLFGDDFPPGKSALLKWKDNKPVQIRQFTLRDYVTQYWDESINPSFYAEKTQKLVEKNLQKLCGQYEANPDIYAMPAEEPELAAKYGILGLRDNSKLRLGNVCSIEKTDKKTEPADTETIQD